MSPPRPKQEYQERESDESGTPLERFKRLVGRVVSVPKEEIDKRERESDGK